VIFFYHAEKAFFPELFNPKHQNHCLGATSVFVRYMGVDDHYFKATGT
jgi:hypothetical protein